MNYWILQSSTSFDILKWLSNFNWLGDKTLLDCWHISRFKDKVSREDIAFIWKPGGTSHIRGIYAKGQVETLPKKFPLADKEKGYFAGKNVRAEIDRLNKLKPLAVRYTKICLDKPLRSDAMEEVPELRGLTILKKGGAHSRGIHEVQPAQGKIIESLLRTACQ